MNHYEARQEARRERLLGAADRQEAEATARLERARSHVEGIPFGQPILVGHHSEKRHRAALRRHDQNMRKFSEAYNRAKELRGMAASVGTGGISSDDPDAIIKLQRKLDSLREWHEKAVAVNKAYRKRDHAALAALGVDESALTALDAKIENAYSWEKQPYVKWQLSNNSAEMRRLEKRIAELREREATEPAEPVQIGNITISEDATENRVMLEFPKELIHVREALKRAGYRWSPTRTAWVRMRGRNIFEYTVRLVRSLLCEGEQDDNGPTCCGLDVRKVVAQEPGAAEGSWFEARYCADCRKQALAAGYLLQESAQ